jgi:hypothetical protein
MLLFGLDGGYTFLVGATQGLVSGIVRTTVLLREVHVSTGSRFLHGSKAGQVRFQVGGPENYSRGRSHCFKRTSCSAHFYTALVSREQRNWGGQKGATVQHANTNTQSLLFFKPLVSNCLCRLESFVLSACVRQSMSPAMNCA